MLHQNVVLMAHFAFELIRTLNRINREIFNDLKMRIGERFVTPLSLSLSSSPFHTHGA